MDEKQALREAAEARLVASSQAKAQPETSDVLLHELRVHQIELEMQNETLRAAQLSLEASRDRYADLYDFAPTGYLTVSRSGVVLEANLTAAAMLGLERSLLIGRHIERFVASPEQDRWHQFFLNLLKCHEKQSIELMLEIGANEDFYVQLDGLCVAADDGNSTLRVALTDVTLRRQAARVLAEAKVRAESEEKFRTITESAQDAIVMIGADQCITFWNAAAERIFGYTAAEALGRQVHALLSLPSSQSRSAHAFAFFQATGQGPVIGKVVELTAIRKGGETFPVELSVSATRLNEQWQAIAIIRDISERKRMEEALLDSEVKFHTVYESSGDAIMLFGDEGFFDCNEAALRIFGCHTQDEFINKHPSQFSPPVQPGGEDSTSLANAHIAAALENGSNRFEWMHVRTDGSEFPADVLLTSMELKGLRVLQATVRDITERKQAELALQHSNRALSVMSVVNRTLIHATDEDTLMHDVCQIIVGQAGYRMAWVGYVQHDEKKSIRTMASAGFDEGFLKAAAPIWAESELGMGPSGLAVRSGSTQVCQDLAHDPEYLPWRDAALSRGYFSCISLPLIDADKTVFGILNVYADRAGAFVPAEIRLLEEMAADLSFGVRSLRTRIERDFALEKNRHQLAQLAGNLEDTVRAIATIVEIRDPYTAGHQLRVADLAVAIATLMELPQERVHGLHIAGILHDLGKIQIPAEILSKPGRISNTEYALIKTHCRAGYDILKGIEFPWPVAQAVLQHHERMDGSGYPQGLSGEAILLEARILCVADVVEAIFSHRPYRPGLGIDAALNEINSLRGISYDPDVVDACVRLFSERGYVFRDAF